MPRRKRPRWWTWELELTPHLHKRMLDRGFTEVDVRTMLGAARRIRRDVVAGRWVAETRFRRTRWEVIVEPDDEYQLLVVVTAYPLV